MEDFLNRLRNKLLVAMNDGGIVLLSQGIVLIVVCKCGTPEIRGLVSMMVHKDNQGNFEVVPDWVGKFLDHLDARIEWESPHDGYTCWYDFSERVLCIKPSLISESDTVCPVYCIDSSIRKVFDKGTFDFAWGSRGDYFSLYGNIGNTPVHVCFFASIGDGIKPWDAGVEYAVR